VLAWTGIPHITKKDRMYKRFLIILFLPVALGAFAASETGKEVGFFEGRVLVEWLDDPFVPTMRLVESFEYHEASGRVWKVPAGHVVKGRGMPPLFRDLIGQPFQGGFRKAAIVYDYTTQAMEEPWDEAQLMFLEASMAEGVIQSEAKVMYLLLRAQGSRWEVPGSRCYGSCHGKTEPLLWRPVVDDSAVGELLGWVRRENPSLLDIEQRAETAVLDRGPHVFPVQPCLIFSGSTLVGRRC
jgi:hypothetical protein